MAFFIEIRDISTLLKLYRVMWNLLNDNIIKDVLEQLINGIFLFITDTVIEFIHKINSNYV
ncbi:hypothetical protein CK516_31770 [Nostoc sp. 'Peltigera malacea cyanobiont' DB3992]|nr:hypothetical protein CK516_31770 [Nostoc sp. 'Peltigera malacea cyanobiont' DB3992]